MDLFTISSSPRVTFLKCFDHFSHSIDSLVQTIASRSTHLLDIPRVRLQIPQSHFIDKFVRLQSVRKILFVGQNNSRNTPLHSFVVENGEKFVASLCHTGDVRRVNDENKSFGSLVIMSPQRSNLFLAPDIPHCEGDVFDGCHFFDVETDGGNCRHIFVQFQLVQNRCLSCCVQAEKKDACTLRTELTQGLGKFRQPQTHGYCCMYTYESVEFVCYYSLLFSVN